MTEQTQIILNHGFNNIDEENITNRFQSETPIEQYNLQVKELFGYAFEQIEYYTQMLIKEGQIRGLIGPKELSRIWSRHIVNCAALSQYLPKHGTVADIGSGAGLPGIVIAIMKPELDIYLVETMQRRVEWLHYCVQELGLDNVTILHNRAEELQKKIKFDCVTARAVGATEKLAKWTAPLLKPGGKMLLLKGEKALDELKKAKYVLKKLKLQNSKIHKVKSVMNNEQTTVVEITKIK